MDSVKKNNLWKIVKSKLTTEDIFHETQIRANKLGAVVMAASGIILAVILILNTTGIFRMNSNVVFFPLIHGIVETGIVTALCIIFRFDKWWLKYLLVIGLCVAYARLDGIFTHRAAILMAVPVIFSSRYFSRRLTVFTTVLCAGLFFVSAIWGTFYGLFDLNLVTMEEGTVMLSEGGYLDQAVLDTGFDRKQLLPDALLFSYLPKACVFTVISIISINIANRGRQMVIRQHEKDVEDARIESELKLAGRIQSDMLRNDWPAFPDRNEFDIYASVRPARIVGGDFYDFFMTDDDHLCLIIADVSGKGIPAALFMSRAMTIIKSAAVPEKTPDEILSDVNVKLCDNNEDEMFVTAWMGLLDIRTGRLRAVNAGHEYPFFKKPGGEFEMIKDKHGFVLGGMPDAKYTGYTIQMDPGSTLFLYTDGLVETENEKHEFLGIDKALSEINKEAVSVPEKILKNMQEVSDLFAGETPQFDDLTMLCITYLGGDDK